MHRRMSLTTEQRAKLNSDRNAAPARRPAMLLSANLEATHELLAPARVIFYALVVVAGLLTFVPFQRRLGLPGLALEGVAGSFLLLYTLAFVPPPTARLFVLPETPVYLIFAAAVFWGVSAI